MLKPSRQIPALPPPVDLETKPVLKALAKANRALAELKGRAKEVARHRDALKPGFARRLGPRSRTKRVANPFMFRNIFRHPYTRVEYVVQDLGIVRQTAARRLDALAEQRFLEKHQAGRNNYYINVELVKLLMDASEGD